MEQALANTNEQTDSVLSRAKQNFVPSSKQLIKDTVEMITNPVQTAKSLYELGSGIVQLAIPGEQGNEDMARAVGQHFADRYGSIEKAKETFATDPAGFAVDALGVITGGASLGVGVAKAGAKAVSKVGRKVDVDDGVADAQLQAARESRAKEPDRSGMGDLGDGIQPSLYDEALEVSDKYGNNSIFKDEYLPGDADDYLKYMDDTKELRNSSTIPNDYGLSATEFFETLSTYSNKNIIKYEGASESPGFLSELKSMNNKDPWYSIKENGDVILNVNRSLERPVPGKPKRRKTLKISGGKKQPTKQEILEFLDIDPKVLKNSLDESVGNTGEYKEILFDMDKLKEQGIARAESLADDGLKKGGTVMELAMGGTPGVAKGDDLKDPSILDPKTSKEKAKDKDIKDKVSSVAKRPQSSNTNIQTAMLLNPEEVLKKYEKPMMLNEGAMPVTEEEIKEQSTRQQRRSQIINQLDEAGLSVPAIKAIVGNIDIETGGTFSHTQKQEGGNGYGLFQFDFQKPYYDKYLESQNLEDSISSQVSYFLNEINTGDTIGAGNAKSIMDVFNDPKATPKEATIILVDKFFKPGKPHLERRIASAMQGYDEELEGFKEGGLADNADDTPGATESEVADDIPAMISEGELVVPANVVRYHGLSKYENMRKTALKALDELEDNGQIRPVDENGTPVVKDVKEQTDEVMASKGAIVARYNEGGSPTIEEEPKTNFPIKDEKVIGRPVDPDLKKDLKPVGPRVTTREGQTITPDDSGNKATLRTPEGKNYRVTNPDTKITATGPRTTGIVGGNYTGVDLENMPGFGVDRSGSTVSGPSTTEKLLSGVATVAALDKLFLDGAITESVFNWARNNIFDPVGKFLGFDKAAAANAGIITSGATAAMTGTSITVGNTIVPIGSKVALTTGAPEAGLFSGSQYTTMVDGKIVRLTPGEAYIVSGGETGVYDGNLTNVNTSGSASTKTGADLTGEAPMSSNGVWNWKTGLAAVGAGLSLYDIIENGPSVGNVAGLGYSTGVLAQSGLLGAGAQAATTGTALGSAVSVLGYVALAAGVISLFKGPPSTYVGEAAIDFDKDIYSPDDIIVGGFTGSKFSQENRDGAEALINTAGGYVAALEESLEINIGGELFIDVGNEFGLRYGYVDGYDELGMYKYHEKDLDYKLLHGQGQVGKGLRGDDAAEKMMNKINDDINVVTMFALADKAAGGEGYATFDKMGEYRKKISVLSTYRPGMAGSGAKAVLTDQERNILDGFQKKEFAEVTGDELAALMPIYDKIAPVQQQNSFNFNSLGM